ncbi:phytanoyl-CoA dioxygenase family protein [Lichenicoccus roseus]|uniref:Phytanoyl-CoA dioxygenase family protein n=1 Tax=Lichenicoccus roseus TaxID=2683649 RepID=A0A5R9J2F1_9PROT|nr:phytanoyl-CoA dioxygenase family protein [Lichenicoccus roseus]TLU71810.1 phytanoyl-CoA dioxygenase family protein [Lichenicoccus roseus]
MNIVLTAPADRLPNDAEIATMRETGTLVVPGFFGPGQTASLVGWTGEIASRPEVVGGQMVYHEDSLIEPGRRVVQRIEDFCSHHPQMDQAARNGALTRWLDLLMGGATVLFKDKINFKYPGGDGFKAHQDQAAGWSRYAPLFVTALVTIDAATIENGCLEIATAPRARGLLGEEWAPLAEDELGLVAVPTQPGDVIFFDSYVAHASKPNLTAAPRRVLYLTYNLAEAGDHRARYFAEKRAAFPPDIERAPGSSYVFRV